MKELEEEVTQLSLNRYKEELEQKQKHLKQTKKYDEQIREFRAALGYVFSITGVENVPEYLSKDLTVSIYEVSVGKDLQATLE